MDFSPFQFGARFLVSALIVVYLLDQYIQHSAFPLTSPLGCVHLFFRDVAARPLLSFSSVSALFDGSPYIPSESLFEMLPPGPLVVLVAQDFPCWGVFFFPCLRDTILVFAVFGFSL